MLRRWVSIISIISSACIFTSCGSMGTGDTADTMQDSTVVPKRDIPDRMELAYVAVSGKDSSLKSYSGNELAAILFLNRCDESVLKKKDTVIVPTRFADNIMQYSPFPFYIAMLKEVKKIVFFSYPTQVFAAYENGYLTHTGPTNMGRKADPTPTGLFFANWKAEETKSTFNDEWELKWNFNIENKLGVGWHQYALPGYPASHSCLRMLEDDAKFMYEWADQWVLEGTDNVKANGTPVIVFGSYPFDGPKPWLALLQNPKALDISEEQINALIQPNLQKILDEQNKRQQFSK